MTNLSVFGVLAKFVSVEALIIVFLQVELVVELVTNTVNKAAIRAVTLHTCLRARRLNRARPRGGRGEVNRRTRFASFAKP